MLGALLLAALVALLFLRRSRRKGDYDPEGIPSTRPLILVCFSTLLTAFRTLWLRRCRPHMLDVHFGNLRSVYMDKAAVLTILLGIACISHTQGGVTQPWQAQAKYGCCCLPQPSQHFHTLCDGMLKISS